MVHGKELKDGGGVGGRTEKGGNGITGRVGELFSEVNSVVAAAMPQGKVNS